MLSFRLARPGVLLLPLDTHNTIFAAAWLTTCQGIARYDIHIVIKLHNARHPELMIHIVLKLHKNINARQLA